jgi:protein-disulfide isomerase
VSAKRERRAAARAERVAALRREEAAAARARRLRLLGGVAALAVVLVIAAVAVGSSGGDEEAVLPPAGPTRVFAGLPQDGRAVGRPDAPVVLEEFGELQCPACGAFARETLPTVVERYVRTGRLRLEFRALSFIGPDSEPAARAALAAGLQDRLWPFVEAFYARQGKENSGYVTDAFLREVGRAVPGLDVERALAQRSDAAVDRGLREDGALAREVGVEGTPTFFLRRADGRREELELQSLAPDAVTRALDAALGPA